MKLLFLTLILTLAFGAVVQTNAQQNGNQQVSVRVGKQKKASRSKLDIKFVSLIEDSRCAEGATCIWAGNAKIQVKIKSAATGWKTFEMNTNLGPKGDILDGYAINLVSLTPSPKANTKTNTKNYTATFAISRLTR